MRRSNVFVIRYGYFLSGGEVSLFGAQTRNQITFGIRARRTAQEEPAARQYINLKGEWL